MSNGILSGTLAGACDGACALAAVAASKEQATKTELGKRITLTSLADAVKTPAPALIIRVAPGLR
jgi:hypothetical protein